MATELGESDSTDVKFSALPGGFPTWLVGPLDLDRRDASDGFEVSVNVEDGQAPGFDGGGDQEIHDGRTLVVAEVYKTVLSSFNEAPGVVR